MSAQLPLYQVLCQRVTAALAPHIPAASVTRLALLAMGILAAKSAVLAQIAAELDALALTQDTMAESIARRLRRTLYGAKNQSTRYTCHNNDDWPLILKG